MKKLFCLALALLFCLTLVACNSTGINQDVVTAPSSEIDVTAERKEKLKEAFDTYCDDLSGYAELSDDETSLTIDTNPFESKLFNESTDAANAILKCNTFLGFPSSVTAKMKSTRALDGMQSQSCGDYTASWTYHPDKGLMVIYEVNFD